MSKTKRQNEEYLLKEILYRYLEKGTIEEEKIVDKFDESGYLITKTIEKKTSEIPIQDLLRIYEMINKLNEGNLDELLLGIKVK